MMGPVVTSLVLTAWLVAVAGKRLDIHQRRILAALAAVIWLLPWPWGLAHWLPAYLGQFSLVTGLLAADVLGRQLGVGGWLAAGERRAWWWLLVVIAPFFYPLSLGVSGFDPYALGFGDFRLSTGLLVLGLYFWISRDYGLCLLLVAAQVGWRLELLPSDNLWDYLFDPWLVGWAVVGLVRKRDPLPGPAGP